MIAEGRAPRAARKARSGVGAMPIMARQAMGAKMSNLFIGQLLPAGLLSEHGGDQLCMRHRSTVPHPARARELFERGFGSGSVPERESASG